MKHTRRIRLTEWQQELAERWPKALLRGLVQSDGCRFTNTRGRSDTWVSGKDDVARMDEFVGPKA